MATTAKTLLDALTAKQKQKRLRQQNEKMRIEIGRLKKEYAPIAEYKEDVVRVITVAKTRLLGIPAKVAPRVHAAQSVVDVQQILLTEIRDVLSELASGVDEVNNEYTASEENASNG